MIKRELCALIAEAIARAQAAGALPKTAVPEITLEPPRREEWGDYACSAALKMARSASMKPIDVATAIVNQLGGENMPPAVITIEAAPNGFINIHLNPDWLRQQLDAILLAGARYGEVPLGDGRAVQVEYVSANPTGPLHVGAGRGAALGDTLANVLAHAGYAVQREYYVNDAGSRMDAFYGSVYALYAQQFGIDEQVPADGYPGEYMAELAQELAREHGRRFLELPRVEAQAELGRLGMARLIEGIRDDLAEMGVRFDDWYSEQSLFDRGLVAEALERLRAQGYVAEREGAVWFTSSELGEDKDNVLIRSNGVATYFASDIAYHYDKLVRREFDTAIDIWGADHQGHVPRMKAVLTALGLDPERLRVVVYQLVNLVREGKPVRMGKRTGTFVTLREVLREVGPDAVRFDLVARSADAMLEFDLDRAKKESNENPVFYVQYAHARCAGILARAAARPEPLNSASGDTRLLTHDAEMALIRKMTRLPEVVETAALTLAPHSLPHYALELAAALTTFYEAAECRVVGDEIDPALSRARLKLVAACQVALANVLRLIGVTAPEEMARRPRPESGDESEA
ncbi:MAG TPA: arginine--tRNA ligase [Chloroflexota bacterium]|jgi:arginyl-tRNA synthetase